MTRILLAAGLACAVSGTAAAEDLLDVYRLAQQSDPTWAAAQANYRATLEQVPQARSLLRPNVDAFAEAAKNNQQVTTPLTDNAFRYRSDGYTLELSQPLYNRENRATYDQAKETAAQAEFELAAARDDLILRAARAYLAFLAAYDAHDYAQSEKSAVQRLLALARRNFNVGAATLIDVHDAEAAYDLATAQEIAAANELAVRREALRILTGTAPQNLARLEGKLDLTAPAGEIEDWVTRAGTRNPQVGAAERSVARASQEIAKQRAGHAPTLDMVAARTFSDANNLFGTPTENTIDLIGVRLHVPLYQGGRVDSRVREAAARRDEAQQRLESVRRQTAQEARAAYLAVINGVSQVRALEQARGSNQRALQSTVAGQERGLRTGLDVLTTQRVLFRTLRDLAAARYDYMLSRLQLQAVAGALGEEHLEQINRLLSVPR